MMSTSERQARCLMRQDVGSQNMKGRGADVAFEIDPSDHFCHCGRWQQKMMPLLDIRLTCLDLSLFGTTTTVLNNEQSQPWRQTPSREPLEKQRIRKMVTIWQFFQTSTFHQWRTQCRFWILQYWDPPSLLKRRFLTRTNQDVGVDPCQRTRDVQALWVAGTTGDIATNLSPIGPYIRLAKIGAKLRVFLD